MSGSASRERVWLSAAGDPRAAGTWSGIPAALARAIERRGHTVDAIDVAPVSPWDRMRAHADRLRVVPAAVAGSGVPSVRATSYNLALASPAPLRRRRPAHVRAVAKLPAGTVLIQTHPYLLPPGSPPSVVFTDMTFAQAVRSDWKGYAAAPSSWQRRGRAFEQAAMREAAVCCAASRWCAESLINDVGITPDAVQVVGLGADPPTASAAPARDWSNPRFLFIGLDWVRKNGDVLVSAFQRVRLDHPGAELDLVGEHPRIDVPGVRAHGILRSSRAEEFGHLESLFAGATCLVLPSKLEPFGMVYVEAGLRGVPSIGTTCGGAADAIGSGGLLVDPDDEATLVAAMQKMANPDRAQALGAEALAHARTLTWDAVAGRILTAVPAASQPPNASRR